MSSIIPLRTKLQQNVKLDEEYFFLVTGNNTLMYMSSVPPNLCIFFYKQFKEIKRGLNWTVAISVYMNECHL